MAKFIINTSGQLTSKTKSFIKDLNQTATVYKPGWYGSVPHFKVSAPYEDSTGRQHLTFTIQDAPGCDPRAVGHVIGKGHVPAGYQMIKSKDLIVLRLKEKKYGELLKKQEECIAATYNFADTDDDTTVEYISLSTTQLVLIMLLSGAAGAASFTVGLHAHHIMNWLSGLLQSL